MCCKNHLVSVDSTLLLINNISGNNNGFCPYLIKKAKLYSFHSFDCFKKIQVKEGKFFQSFRMRERKYRKIS